MLSVDTSFYCLYCNLLPLSRRDVFSISYTLPDQQEQRPLATSLVPICCGGAAFRLDGVCIIICRVMILWRSVGPTFTGAKYTYLYLMNIQCYLVTNSLERLWAGATSQFSLSDVFVLL